MLNQTLYSVGVGDFIAYKGVQFYASGKFCTETNMEFTSNSTDLRAGKRAPMVCRYFHSSNATFSIVAANYAPEIMKASMGGQDVSYGCVPQEESLTMATRTITLSNTPVATGDIPATVWIKNAKGQMLGALTATGNTVVIPSDGAYAGLADNSTVCATYIYKNLAAETFTIPAQVNPDILHIFVDIDLFTDKSGSGKVGRQVIEIPLAQLSPDQTINATMDGYSQSKLTGTMLADKSNATNACGDHGVYAYITTEITAANWYDNVYALTNDIDNIELANSASVGINLLGLQYGGNYMFISKDYYDGGDSTKSGLIHFTFSAGTATGTTFDATTGVITAGSTDGTATLQVSVNGVTSIPTYTLEIDVA